MTTETSITTASLLEDFLAQNADAGFAANPTDSPAGRAILDAPAEQRAAVASGVFCLLAKKRDFDSNVMALKQLLGALLRQQLPLSATHFSSMIGQLADAARLAFIGEASISAILQSVATMRTDSGFPDEVGSALEGIWERWHRLPEHADQRKYLSRIDALLGRKAPPPKQKPAPFPQPQAPSSNPQPMPNPNATIAELVELYLNETIREGGFALSLDVAGFPAGLALLERPREQQAEALVLVAGRAASVRAKRSLINALMRKKLTFTLPQLERLVELMIGTAGAEWWYALPPAGILKAIEDHAAARGMPESLHAALRKLSAKLRGEAHQAEARKLADRVDELVGSANPASPIPFAAPQRQAFRQAIDAFVVDYEKSFERHGGFLGPDPKAGQFPAAQAILDMPRERQTDMIVELVSRQVRLINGPQTTGSVAIMRLIGEILRKKLPFTADHLETLLRTMTGIDKSGWWSGVSPKPILRAVEEQTAAQGLSSGLRDALDLLAAKLRQHQYYAEVRDLLARVEELRKLPAAPPAIEPGVLPVRRAELTTDEAWTRLLRDRLARLDKTARQNWDALLALCNQASSAKPSGKWTKQAKALIDAIGADHFAELARATFGEVGKPGGVPHNHVNALGFTPDPTQVHDKHSDILRGLVWSASLVENDELTTALGDTADVCFKKLTGIGPRAPKIGNACLWALSNMSTQTAVAQLGRIKSRAKHASVKKQLGKAMDTAAEKTGMSAADLEEVAVPTFGLTAVGECRKPLGDWTALLHIADGAVELTWLKPDGKPQASVPASVKESFAEDLKALKKAEKDLEKQLPAQRARLERLFAQERTWSLADWRARFIDHPLVGTLARRLIWRFTCGDQIIDGIWHDGKLIGVDGKPLQGSEQARVSLWHPIHAAPEEVRARRDRLEALEVRQPFKQAHREVYILTDAERSTGAYSNRFAAHVIKQHQFNALCFDRGWQYRLQGAWDSANTPTLQLPHLDLRAEFWVESIEEQGDPMLERADVSHHMVYLYVTTDQVRFYRGDSPIPLALVEVPPLAFSEVMRDVDLFVGVASVGNDPNWQDGGLVARFGHYWDQYSFGGLFPSAQTRKEVLQKILPRLTIADRCSFTERYLVVRGDLKTYQIHLGSGSIKMSPNDQYLCIVADQKARQASGKVYLPFEGDSMLSVILSKALLLAEDIKIKDPSIVRQIRPPEVKR